MVRKVSFLEVLDIDYEKYPVIAVVGGGGKTSLIHRLTEELLQRNTKVIITTTTHMAYEPSHPFASDGNGNKIQELLDRYGYVYAAHYDEEKEKIASLPREVLESIRDYGAVVLIEADGAHRKPVKVPEAWEPVIPSLADMVIGVTGLDCLGKTISETAHRPERTASFLNKELTDVMRTEDVIKIASSPLALRKNAENREYRVFFNKTDIFGGVEEAWEIKTEIAGLLEKTGIKSAFGSLKEAEIL